MRRNLDTSWKNITHKSRRPRKAADLPKEPKMVEKFLKEMGLVNKVSRTTFRSFIASTMNIAK